MLFSPRQNLIPKEAFISFEHLQDQAKKVEIFSSPYDFIIAISHIWLTEPHPDPYCTTLRTIQNGLKDYHYIKEKGWVFGIFWDYMSLYQHIDPCDKTNDTFPF